MKNLFDTTKSFQDDLDLRVYTSNLLGGEANLVLHGGGNTSVKTVINGEEILHVKGSGWDLSDIKREGFAPVKMSALLDMAKMETLSDSDMVQLQQAAMIDKTAPNPSVEAILHALIPYKFVDHTHADAIVTISNSKNGKRHIKELFPNFLIVPYVMPGFILAKAIYEMTQGVNWDELEGIILHNHGIFTFDNDAQKAYTKMIEAVSKAEEFLEEFASLHVKRCEKKSYFSKEELQNALLHVKDDEVYLEENSSDEALFYASCSNLESLASRGVLTPEHIIRTKRVPLILKEGDEIKTKLEEYAQEYKEYFQNFATDEVMLNPYPNYIVIQNQGIFSIGKNKKEACIINDIVSHTIQAVLRADKLGGYESIGLKDSFEMEYWELEQAKLRK